MEAAGSLWRMGFSVLAQLEFADPVLCLRGMVCVSSQLPVELGRADVGSVLIRYTVGAKCLVHNRYCEFLGPTGLPNNEAVLTDERLRFETNVLDVNGNAHLAPAAVAGQSIPTDLLLSFWHERSGGVPGAMTPRPYSNCWMYCLFRRDFTRAPLF
jgi:hypothetical protein